MNGFGFEKGLDPHVIITMLIMAIPFVIMVGFSAWNTMKGYKSQMNTYNPYSWNHFKISKRRSNVNAERNEWWDKKLNAKTYQAFNLHRSDKAMQLFAIGAEKYKRDHWNMWFIRPNILNIINAIVNIAGFGFIGFPFAATGIAACAKLLKIDASGSIPSVILFAFFWGLFLIFRMYKMYRSLKDKFEEEPAHHVEGNILDSWNRRGLIMDEILRSYHFDGNVAALIEYAKSSEAIENQYAAYLRCCRKDSNGWVDYYPSEKTHELVSDNSYDRNTLSWWVAGVILFSIFAVLLVQLSFLFRLVAAFFGPFLELL